MSNANKRAWKHLADLVDALERMKRARTKEELDVADNEAKGHLADAKNAAAEDQEERDARQARPAKSVKGTAH